MNRAFVRKLAAEAAECYRPAGRFARLFARGKLAGDPVFPALLRLGLIPDGARILDLGCGQGLLAAWLLAAGRVFERAGWPSGWPPPPRFGGYRGIELLPAEARRAASALGDGADIVTGDLRSVPLGSADVVVILDVLHFLEPAAQAELLARCRAALVPEGRLLLRVGDAAGGWRFRYSVAVDRCVARLRGHRRPEFHCRTRTEWKALLAGVGFAVDILPLADGPPFANVLVSAGPAARAGGPGSPGTAGRA